MNNKESLFSEARDRRLHDGFASLQCDHTIVIAMMVDYVFRHVADPDLQVRDHFKEPSNLDSKVVETHHIDISRYNNMASADTPYHTFLPFPVLDPMMSLKLRNFQVCRSNFQVCRSLHRETLGISTFTRQLLTAGVSLRHMCLFTSCISSLLRKSITKHKV